MVGRGQRRRGCIRSRFRPPGSAPAYCSANPWITLLQADARLRVQRVEQLVEIDHFARRRRRQRGARGQRRRAVGSRRESDVAVGDGRQRRHPDLGHRAQVKRCQRGVDVDRDLRLVVMGQRDARDAAHRHAADLHLVAPHELAGFAEDQLVVGAASAGEQEVGDDQHDEAERAERDHAPGAGRQWPGAAGRRERTRARRRRGAAGGLGGLTVAIRFLSARALGAGLVGDRRRRRPVGDGRVGNLAQPRDQFRPLVGAERPSRTRRRRARRRRPRPEADVDVGCVRLGERVGRRPGSSSG